MFQSFWWFHFPFLVVSILQENLISWIGDGFFNRATFKEGMNIFFNDWLSYAEMSKPAKFHGVYDPSPSQTKVSMVGIFGWLKSQHLSCFFPLFFPRKIAWVHHVPRCDPTPSGRLARAGRLRRRGSRLCGEQLPGRFDATGGDEGMGWDEKISQSGHVWTNPLVNVYIPMERSTIFYR